MTKLHFIGIGGIGMSGLARLALARNQQTAISGSDISSNATTEGLIKQGIQVHLGHNSSHIQRDMTVIYSTDIKKENPEFQTALKLKCPMMHRSEFLQKLIENHHSIAIAGTHGKTTTSSLMTWVLKNSGYSPSYVIGGMIPQLNANADQGSGKHFVIEACESDGSFLNYNPSAAIVTNIDLDHMDYYHCQEALLDAFRGFMQRIDSQQLLWCADDPLLTQLGMPGISYGFSKEAALRASQFKQHGWSITFDIEFRGQHYPCVDVSLTGQHNALNALAVFGMALLQGVPEKEIRAALCSFNGVLRRCEKKGEVNGILFLDDYAHHPTELRATLKAIRAAIGERRLIALYQPHRYSRAKECMGLYQKTFDAADELFITEIYAAGEVPIPGVTHDKIIDEIRRDSHVPLHFVPRKELAQTLAAHVRPHDVVVTLGAGDITKASSEIIAQLALQPTRKIKVGVISGGASVEHEISQRSVANILKELNREYYEIINLFITRDGEWQSEPGHSESKGVKLPFKILEKVMECDILFPVLHGTYGEDGTIQGLFEMLSKAYVGCDYRSSAICMDKIITKRLMRDAGIATSPFLYCSHEEWTSNAEKLLADINNSLSYPVFVKPAHLGSSIGIHKVVKPENLSHAIEDAFLYDTDILVENGIQGRELEFAVLGNSEPTTFPPGEILTGGRVYDYVGKYSEDGIPTTAKAILSQELIEKGMIFAKKAYRGAHCRGFARVDVFLDNNNHYWLNEINPIPGFTNSSLYPQMCAAHGLPCSELLDRLLILGLRRRRQVDRLFLSPEGGAILKPTAT